MWKTDWMSCFLLFSLAESSSLLCPRTTTEFLAKVELRSGSKCEGGKESSGSPDMGNSCLQEEHDEGMASCRQVTALHSLMYPESLSWRTMLPQCCQWQNHNVSSSQVLTISCGKGLKSVLQSSYPFVTCQVHVNRRAWGWHLQQLSAAVHQNV